MKAWIFSDIHLEIDPDFNLTGIPEADVCICSGDLRAGSGNLDSQDKWNFCLTSA